MQTAERRYVYDGVLLFQERDGNNLPQTTYTRGLDLSNSLEGAGGIGGLLARSGGPLGRSHSYYHSDGSGDITRMIDVRGNLQAGYHYDPFGNLIGKSGILADANTQRFSSKPYHPKAGLSYFGYRFYDSNLQRWLNRDPLGEQSLGKICKSNSSPEIHSSLAI